MIVFFHKLYIIRKALHIQFETLQNLLLECLLQNNLFIASTAYHVLSPLSILKGNMRIQSLCIYYAECL